MTGNELRKRRDALGLSQAQAAVLVGRARGQGAPPSRSNVYRWERRGDSEIPAYAATILRIKLRRLEATRDRRKQPVA